MPPRNRPDARRSDGAPNLVPVFMTIGVVVVAALGVAVMTQQDDSPAAGPGPEEPSVEQRRSASSSAFGDIDTSPGAVSRGGGSKLSDKAPAGVADAAAFQEGRALAAEGKALLDEALAAQKAGDADTYREKANAAREKYERAMEVTADWEIDLIGQYGSDDRQVTRIGKEIDVWRKQMNTVRKVH